MLETLEEERSLTPHHLMAAVAFGDGAPIQVLVGPRDPRDPIRLALEAGWIRLMTDHEGEFALEMALAPTPAQQQRVRGMAEQAEVVTMEVVEAANSSRVAFWSGRLPGSRVAVGRALRRAVRSIEELQVGPASPASPSLG